MQVELDTDVALEDEVIECASEADSAQLADASDDPATKPKKPRSKLRFAALVCIAAIVGLAGLAGWFEYRVQQAHQAQAQRDRLVAAARQGALNLTTIDWQKADADVKRILDGATGQFHDDFAARSKPFVDVVKQAKSSSVGTISAISPTGSPGRITPSTCGGRPSVSRITASRPERSM